MDTFTPNKYSVFAVQQDQSCGQEDEEGGEGGGGGGDDEKDGGEEEGEEKKEDEETAEEVSPRAKTAPVTAAVEVCVQCA